MDSEELHSLIQEKGVVLPYDKELGKSSFSIVAAMRKATGVKKIGHAGTLDPLATGLLILCIGRRATRHIDSFQSEEKEYTGTIVFGAESETDDSEGPIHFAENASHLELQEIQEAANTFIGEIHQIPPRYSARKIGGKRMYSMARRGEEFEPKAAIVNVSEFDIGSLAISSILDNNSTEKELPCLTFRIQCGKGTYIRSLARDLGEKLGTKAFLSSLRRTKSGDFSVNNAMTSKYLQTIIESKEFRKDADLA